MKLDKDSKIEKSSSFLPLMTFSLFYYREAQSKWVSWLIFGVQGVNQTVVKVCNL